MRLDDDEINMRKDLHTTDMGLVIVVAVALAALAFALGGCSISAPINVTIPDPRADAGQAMPADMSSDDMASAPADLAAAGVPCGNDNVLCYPGQVCISGDCLPGSWFADGGCWGTDMGCP